MRMAVVVDRKAITAAAIGASCMAQEFGFTHWPPASLEWCSICWGQQPRPGVHACGMTRHIRGKADTA